MDWAIIAFAVFVYISLIVSLTVRGSGISERPYGKVYTGVPGARGAASATGRDDRVTVRDWSRGTR